LGPSSAMTLRMPLRQNFKACSAEALHLAASGTWLRRRSGSTAIEPIGIIFHGARLEDCEPTAAVMAPARCRSLPVRRKACCLSSYIWQNRDAEAWERRVCYGDKMTMDPRTVRRGVERDGGRTECFECGVVYEWLRGADKSQLIVHTTCFHPNRIP
jgi:hypothetical protein